MKTLFTFSAFTFMLFLSSCKKDYTCTCEEKKSVGAIYYNNKVETAPTSSSTYDYESINGKEKEVKAECSAKNNTIEEENTSLPEDRTGGIITYTTTCSIQ